ncbi:hypothetical protein F3Y22_tig00110332pilonHSYRG00817 [Hibiscus syriacus]|uniref:MMS19 nucleotide excision repair protein n=1 Tax=Hibiscus syriacus TaxID=106335 RepID=A0A6A3B1E8_HIBSY|nr:hypothetical protein F3Y22_tig00110332pilonHSYRG00817 [Hibiscus syriacus]
MFGSLSCVLQTKGEDVKIKRDDLARALMLLILVDFRTWTYDYEERCIAIFTLLYLICIVYHCTLSLPFLLLFTFADSKMSAKLDSLRYLSDCTVKYEVDRMAKHVKAIWSSLKEVIFTTLESDLSFTPESLEGLDLPENEIAAEAPSLLQKLIVQNTKLSLDLIVGDEDINMIFNMVSSYKNYYEIPSEIKRETTCSSRLMDILGLSARISSGQSDSDESTLVSKRCNHGALYLSIEHLSACRDLIGSSETILAASHTEEIKKHLLQCFSPPLSMTFCSAFLSSGKYTHDADMYFGGEFFCLTMM